MSAPYLDVHSPEQIDQIRRLAASLELEFVGVFGRDTIERVIADSLEQLARTAKITTYLPLLASRFARERLLASSRLQTTAVGREPAVFFMCSHNAGRSQIAAGWLRHLSGGAITVWSGGSDPSPSISAAVIEVMSEVGIDLTEEYPKPWTDEIVESADVVVTMGCGDACPVHPGKRYEDWVLPSPASSDVAAVRGLRDEIRPRVERLLTTLQATAR